MWCWKTVKSECEAAQCGVVCLGLVTVGDKRDLISAQISAFIVAAERWDMFAEQHQADMKKSDFCRDQIALLQARGPESFL